MKSKLRVAIIGTGKIGCDLLVKIMRSQQLQCACFIGRSKDSDGIAYAKSLGVTTSVNGAEALIEYAKDYDLVIDATSAFAHLKHAKILKQLAKPVIDLTPAKIGAMCVPSINGSNVAFQKNISMVTCGGQASVPIAYMLGKQCSVIEYVEVVSSISSASAGHATRLNIDEYIKTTEEAIMQFSGCKSAKAILNINPAVPSVTMKTTIFAKVKNPDMVKIEYGAYEIVKQVQLYAPGYRLLVAPYYDGEKVSIILEITGCGDYLPEFAGNLDIITCAAIDVAEKIADRQMLACHKLAV